MFIKLTNASMEHFGEPLWLNFNQVSAIYEHAKVKDGGLTTFVYSRVGGPAMTWEVEESGDKIVKLIEAENAKRQGCSCK